MPPVIVIEVQDETPLEKLRGWLGQHGVEVSHKVDNEYHATVYGGRDAHEALDEVTNLLDEREVDCYCYIHDAN